MEKRADYLITAVRYNSDNTHINQVKIRQNLGSGLGEEKIVSRADVVKMIDQGKKFMTSTLDANKRYQQGAEIQIIKVETRYIKTRKDSSENDNLENLPTF